MKEKRVHPRMEKEEHITATVKSLPREPLLEEKSFVCLTSDLSVDGLQLRTFNKLPDGATIQIHIAFRHPVRAFRHIGRAVWTGKQNKDGTYAIGIEFTDTPREVFAAWRAVVEQMLAANASSSFLHP